MHNEDSHCKPVEELVTSYQTRLDQGLTTEEAQVRLREFGANELAKQERASPFALFLSQFKNTLIIILLAATTLSALLGEIVDAAIISVIVLFCVVLSFAQEYRANNALAALKNMLAPSIRALRSSTSSPSSRWRGVMGARATCSSERHSRAASCLAPAWLNSAALW